MNAGQQKVVTMLRRRKVKGITGLDFQPTFNYNTRISELRAMGYEIIGKRIGNGNPLYRYWLIKEPK